MAMNGIAEAYVFAKGCTDTLKKLRQLMLLNSIMYIGTSYLLSRELGIVGLIYANCFNMFIRSFSCIYFADQHYKVEKGREVHLMGGLSQTLLFYLKIFSGKIYLILTVLAFVACFGL